MIQRYCLFVFCTFLLLLSACSNLNGTRVEPILGGDVNLVKLGDDIAEALITKSFPPLLPHMPGQPILVVTLVENTDMTKTSDFGRALQNPIIAGFVDRGYTAKEIHLRPEVIIQDNRGEFVLSRKLDEIARKQQAQAIVAGTYTLSNRMMYLSVRLISPKDTTILATYEDRLYLDEYSLKLLNKQYEKKNDTLVQPPRESLLDKIFY